MGEMEILGEPPIDELLSDPIMQMLLDVEGMTIDRLRPLLEEAAARLISEAA